MLTAENLRRKNFTPQEFLSSVTATAHNIINEPNLSQLTCGIKLADKMQQLRDAIGKSFHITSAFRSPELNKLVNGSISSWHLQFLACDFNIDGMTPKEGVLTIKDCGVSIDKCFIERGCIHVQTYLNESKNRNIFGHAELIDGKWIVKPL